MRLRLTFGFLNFGSGDAEFFGEGFEKLIHDLAATEGFLVACFGLHGLRKSVEFGKEMIDGLLIIAGWALNGEWAGWVVQALVEGAAGHEATGDSDGAESFEAVGILDEFRFEGLAGDPCGEAMRFDAMVD